MSHKLPNSLPTGPRPKPPPPPPQRISSLLPEGELAWASFEFWITHPELRKDTLGVWEQLLAFQEGYLACKKFYEIKDES